MNSSANYLVIKSTIMDHLHAFYIKKIIKLIKITCYFGYYKLVFLDVHF